MSVSNRQPFRSSDLGRSRRQIAGAKKSYRPRARKIFFEALEDRRVMAFTPGDVFAASAFTPSEIYNVTGGGNFSGATSLADPGGNVFGQFAWSRNLNTAYLSIFGTGTVIAITSAGVVTPFATGLSGPIGLILTNDDRLLVVENQSGEVTNITAGGDFTGVAPFATGLDAAFNMLQLADGRILIAELGDAEVVELGAGGNLAAKPAFATSVGGVKDLVQSSSGAIFAAATASPNKIYDITAGGDFLSVTPFATGKPFEGLTFDAAGRLLAAEFIGIGGAAIYDVSAGGSFSAVAPFAFNLPSFSGGPALDTVPTPGTLTPTLSSGNLVITDTHATGKDNSLSISNNGAGSIVITDAAEAFASTGGIAGATLSNGGKTLTVPVASITGTQIIINGMAGKDTLTATLTNAIGKTVAFNGGDPTVAPGDKLVVTGGTFATVTLNHTNATDGSVVLGANTINYTGLEPVDVTGSTITDLVINLPDVAGTPDDTELSLTGGGTILTVTSLNATHETDNIALAAFTTVTVNARNGNDTIRIDSTMSTFNKALTLNGNSGLDNFVFEASVAAPGTITVQGNPGADTLDYSGYQVGGVDTAVDFTLTAAGGNGFTGTVKVGGTTITSFSEIDAVTGNTNKTTDSLTGLDAGSTWTIDEPASSKYVSGGTLNFTGLEKLNGGTGDDVFTVTNPAAVAFTLAGGTGGDTLDVTGLGATTVTVTDDGTPAGFDGTFGASNFTSIDKFQAAAGSTFVGDDADSTWTINDGGTNTYATAARSATIAGFNNLQGGSAKDTFNVVNNSTVATYSLKGGDGVDAFNFGNANNLANITNPISVDGETAGATLTLNDQGTATAINYSIAATTIGRTASGTVTFDDITDLTLNATNGTNKLSVTAAPTATGTKTLNGGTGADTLDLTGAGVSAVTITNDNGTAGFDGNFSGVNFTSIDSFQGLAGSTFTGDDAISTWTIIDGGTSTYATAARTANITGFNNLQGGSAKDTFNVVNNSTVATYSLKGGDGVDAFNFGNSNKLDGITNPISVDGETSGATLTLNDQGNMTPFNYSVGNTTINRVGGGVVTYDDITDLTLNASNGSNNITVTAMPSASGTATLNGGTGDDTLEIADINPATVSNLAFTGVPATTGFNGTVTSGTSFNFTGVESINAKGGTAGDTLIGMDAASTWTIDESVGNTSKYVNNGTPARVLRFSGFDTLQGQTAVDTYNVLNNSLTATFSLKGGASLDAFNFGNGNNLDGITNPISVDGEVASATLTLNDQGHANPINYTAGTSTIGRTGSGTVSYSNITALTLNASNGTNKITVTGMPTATGPVLFNGGTGNDTLDLTAAALNPVTVTLTQATLPLLTATGFDGTVSSSGKSFNFTAVEKIDAPTGVGDEIIGINIDATWTINDATGSSYLADLAIPNPDRKLDWSGFEKLTGNSGKDTYKVQNNGTSNPLTLDGKAGADTFLIADVGNKLRPGTVIKSLSVIGNSDAGDHLIVNDQDEAADKDYSISATDVTVLEPGGVVVSHTTVENITLNASDGKNKITVFDGAYAPPTTVKLVDPVGASELLVDDSADTAANTWTITDAKVTRTVPAATALTVDYSLETTITKLSLAGGQSTDDITVTSTKTAVATFVDGGLENDKITVTAGDLDTLAGPLTVAGGGHNLADTRTVFKGGTPDSPTIYKFTAKSSSVAKGDTLIVNDAAQPGFTKYAINNTTVSRTSAAPINVSYSQIELLRLQAGSADSDITATMPLPGDPTQLPFVVQVDGGTAASDNRFQVKGSTGADDITIGDVTATETSRSQFEVSSMRRMWVEGNVGNDTIHNRTLAVPALLDGGRAKDATTTPALANSAVTNENDVISSDAQSNATLSSVLLGNDGKDFLHTRNNGTNGLNPPLLPASTSILIGDYFINPNVPFTNVNVAQRTNRLQVVVNPLLPATNPMRFGESGDRYITEHASTSPRNRAIARLDDAANTYGPGRFENLAVDVTNLTVIQWLQGRLRITITPAGIAEELAVANYYVRQFTREPGSPVAQSPAFPNQTYRPGGVPNGTNPNGGEFVGESATEPAAIVQNPFDAADVNGDGRISAFDALLIINELNLKGPHLLNTTTTTENGEAEPTDFFDVTGDSAVTAFDALTVINRLNQGQTDHQNPDALGTYFRELDQVELESNEAAQDEWASSQPANSLTDEALLSLLAADLDDSEGEEDSAD